MDWDAAIEKNREALKRVLAMLVAMAGLGAAFTSPQGEETRGGRRSSDRRVGVSVGTQHPPQFTLPRHLHRALLALLRPAEAAVRRLVIVAARGIVVPPRKPRSKPVAVEPPLRNLGIAVTIPPADLARAVSARHAATERTARPHVLSLPLLDPLRRWPRPWRPIARSVPRILGLDTPFRPLPAPPSPNDPVSAARLVLRLEALCRALDDLPGQAGRFARWWAARDAESARIRQALDAAGGQVQVKRAAAGARNKKGRRRLPRVWPLKPGRPPGWRRRPSHEVHEILTVVHGLAIWALERPDTS